MMSQFSHRRWRSTALQSAKRIEPNPLFPRVRTSRRRNALPWLVVFGIVTASAFWAAFFSGWFDITYVIVEGNTVIPSERVEAAVRNVFGTRRFGVLPQGNTLFFSSPAATATVIETLEHQQALESLTITKALPAAITVTLTERTPHLSYILGGTTYLLDREGVIAQRSDGETSKKRPAKVLGATTDGTDSFPKLYDLNAHDVAVGQGVVSRQFVDALFTIDAALKASNDIVPQRYTIPPLRCFDVITPEPKDEEKTKEPVNTNTEQGTSAINGSAKKKSNTNTAVNANDNENTNSILDEVEPIPEDQFVETDCAVGERVLQNTELRVTTTEKWDIYLRVDASITDQLARMYRVLNEQRLDRANLDYIDLRFGERVIYK